MAPISFLLLPENIAVVKRFDAIKQVMFFSLCFVTSFQKQIKSIYFLYKFESAMQFKIHFLLMMDFMELLLLCLIL